MMNGSVGDDLKVNAAVLDKEEELPVAMEVEIAIVGAGMGGLALALGLQERGISAHVFEKAPTLRSDNATAVSIALNGIRALDGIRQGLSDMMKAAGSITKSVKSYSCVKGGQPVEGGFHTNYGDLFMVGWNRARGTLSDLISKDKIHLSHCFLHYKVFEGDVDAYFTVNNENNVLSSHLKRIRSKLLVGADGLWSGVRKLMVGDEPRDMHLINWNALVKIPDSLNFKGHQKDQIVFVRDDSPLRVYLVDTGEGITLWLLRLHDVTGEMAKECGNDAGRFGGTGTKERVLKHLEGLKHLAHWEDLKIAIEATDPAMIFERKIFDRVPLTRWSDADCSVLLIGDAAHAMYWGPGQGARTAFEDAHQLSLLLREAYPFVSRKKLQQAVQRFEEIRIPRLTKFQNYAAETSGVPSFVPAWVKQLSREESKKRFVEFGKWASTYPENMVGDPHSVYWN